MAISSAERSDVRVWCSGFRGIPRNVGYEKSLRRIQHEEMVSDVVSRSVPAHRIYPLYLYVLPVLFYLFLATAA